MDPISIRLVIGSKVDSTWGTAEQNGFVCYNTIAHDCLLSDHM
jgi:hypothetical protein